MAPTILFLLLLLKPITPINPIAPIILSILFLLSLLSPLSLLSELFGLVEFPDDGAGADAAQAVVVAAGAGLVSEDGAGAAHHVELHGVGDILVPA